MKIGLIFLVVISVFVGLLFFTTLFRTLKSVLLILQVTPYEQIAQGNRAILVVGDSTGYGTGAGDGRLSVAGLMGKGFSTHSIVNNSKNGRTIRQALEVLTKLPPDAHYELILLQIGANDILQKRNVEDTRNDISQLYTEAKKHTNNVAILSNGNIGASYTFKGAIAKEYTEQSRIFRVMHMETAKAYGVSYIDLFEEPENDVFVQEPKKYTAFDGLHPSAAGYAIWYGKLYPVIKDVLQSD